MPLYQKFLDTNSQTFLWKYDEGELLDVHQLLEPENIDKIKSYHPKKILETLMVRKMLRSQLPHHKILYQDNAPYLSPKSSEISISHSFPFAVLGISEYKIGVDIEKLSSKILNIKDKFIEQKEQLFIPKGEEIKYLTIIWCIKESLYKLHHSKYWSLKKHYEVLPFSENDFQQIKCRVYDENFSDEYIAKLHFLEDYVLSIVTEPPMRTSL